MNWVSCESISRGCQMCGYCVGIFYMRGEKWIGSVWDNGRGDVGGDYSVSKQ